MKEWARPFYKSSRWRKCRRAYYISQHGLCERCPEPGRIVHHKIYLTPDNIDNYDITLDFENLELLCQDCHNKEHFRTHTAIRDGFGFDVHGNLVRSE